MELVKSPAHVLFNAVHFMIRAVETKGYLLPKLLIVASFKGWLESLIGLTTHIIDRNLWSFSLVVSLNVWLERSEVDQELSYQTPAEGAQ